MVDIADYTKKMAQIGINYAFPRTGTIAAISAGVGWYTYQWGLTFGPQLAANAVIRQWEEWVPFAGWYIGKGLSPFIIPQATPYIASQISLGCSLATTLTLNVIAQVFFKIKEQPDHKHLLPQVLAKAGIDLTPSTSQLQAAQKFMEKESLSPLIPPDTTASENEEQENFEETAQPSIKVPTESINAPSNEEEKNPDEDSLLIFEEDSMEKSKCGLNLCF